MHQQTSEILYNNLVGNGYYKIALTCDSAYANAAAGQFVTLKIPGSMDPLLRRPFSIHRLLFENKKAAALEILYRVAGGFTGQMSKLRKTETVDLLGPLGRGFTIFPNMKKPLLAAGGIGVAPMVFLAESLEAAGIDLFCAPVFLGGKTASDILCENDFNRFSMEVNITTEDGSRGLKGIVTEPLEAWIKKQKPDIMYVCGPHGLLHAAAGIAAKHNIRCEVSVETVMACGIGVCMGCAVKTKDHLQGYRHICKDGPVFDASVLMF